MTEAEDKNLETILGTNRQRAPNSPPLVDGTVRTQARDKIINKLFAGDITQGEALKTLRVQVLGVKQDQFAQLVRVSRKTLSDIENDKGNYSVETLNQIFRPFGLKVGLVRI